MFHKVNSSQDKVQTENDECKSKHKVTFTVTSSVLLRSKNGLFNAAFICMHWKSCISGQLFMSTTEIETAPIWMFILSHMSDRVCLKIDDN